MWHKIYKPFNCLDSTISCNINTLMYRWSSFDDIQRLDEWNIARSKNEYPGGCIVRVPWQIWSRGLEWHLHGVRFRWWHLFQFNNNCICNWIFADVCWFAQGIEFNSCFSTFKSLSSPLFPSPRASVYVHVCVRVYMFAVRTNIVYSTVSRARQPIPNRAPDPSAAAVALVGVVLFQRRTMPVKKAERRRNFANTFYRFGGKKGGVREKCRAGRDAVGDSAAA